MDVEVKPRLSEAAERVVRLYEDWGKPEQAAAWKAKLGISDLPANVFARLRAGRTVISRGLPPVAASAAATNLVLERPLAVFDLVTMGTDPSHGSTGLSPARPSARTCISMRRTAMIQRRLFGRYSTRAD